MNPDRARQLAEALGFRVEGDTIFYSSANYGPLAGWDYTTPEWKVRIHEAVSKGWCDGSGYIVVEIHKDSFEIFLRRAKRYADHLQQRFTDWADALIWLFERKVKHDS
jgi:hypothetical protein